MRFPVTVLLLSLALGQLRAQSPLGAVTGLATDPSQAPIPEAKITLISLETGVQREGATNASGVYLFPNLPPGRYKLTAQARGFRNLETEEFPLAAYRTFRQDLRFDLLAAATEVTVTESASSVIQVESPAINTALSSKQILELPTNLRSVYNNAGDSGLLFIMMPLTIPGIVQVGAGAAWLVPGSGANGVRVKVDGIETNFGNFGGPDPVSQPSMESVEEFTANVNSNRAEFSGVGNITSVTRSGGNQFHGSLFWFLRNSALDARNSFATVKPFQNIHNFGASGGGPLRKDKTFFYLTYDATRGSRAYIIAPNVPAVAQRQGDFSAFGVVRDPLNNQPFAGNRIPAARLSPQALRAQDLFFPIPNFGPPTLTAGNYRASFNGGESHYLLEARLDHNFNSSNSGFFRYQHKNHDYKIPGVRTDLPPSSVGTSTNLRNTHFFTVGAVSTLSPNMFNEFRGGVVVLSSKSDSDVKGQTAIEQIGIRGLPPRVGINGVPNIAIAGFSTVRQALLNPVNDGHWQISDNLTWTRGKHAMKTGFEVVHWFVNRHMPVEAAVFGSFAFTSRFSNQAYGDFLLGLPNTVTRVDPYPAQYSRWNNLSFYWQDDFKASPKLTLSYGLRYEYNQAITVRDDNIYSFDPASGAVVLPSANARRLLSPAFPADIPVVTADSIGLPRSLRNGDKNNLAPRFGFSRQLGPDGKTVLRGGWGFYYSPLSGAVTGALASGPYSLASTYNNNIVGGRPVLTLEQPFSASSIPGTLNLNSISPRLLNSYVMQYSLSLERELTRDTGVRVSYIGSRGNQLIYGRNLNQPPASTGPARRPYTRFNNISFSDNGAYSSYSGLQAQVTRRFAKGFQYMAAWTWAKQISEVDDTGSADTNTSIEDAYNRRRDRADVYSVPRHQWTNQALYELPFSGMIGGGWQLNALLNISTGNYLNPQFAGPDSSNTFNFGGRPDVVRAVEYPRTSAAWYNRAAFGVPPNGRFGNAGRNIIEGPGYVVLNCGVMKSLRFEKIGALQVGASFQNLLNHTNLGQPNMTVTAAQGGAITSTHIFPPAGSPRTGMISLRWTY